jgi:cytidyltransferase-like protein
MAGVIFGVFDKFHDGHLDCLSQASRLCDDLTVIVARDDIVHTLKGKYPWQSQEARVAELQRRGFRAVLGDERLGDYLILKIIRPDVLFLGYDQEGLKRDVSTKQASGALPSFAITTLSTSNPDIHTSVLHPKMNE